LSRPFFDSKTTSQSEENSTQSSSPETHRKTQLNISKQPSQDLENNTPSTPSLLKEVGDELSSTMAGRAVTDIAKIASNKMSELMSIYLIRHIFKIFDFI
jgi:hypothetical protein